MVAGRLLDFVMRFMVQDNASRVITGIQERLDKLNDVVKATASFRGAGQNLTRAGASLAGAHAGGDGAAIALPLKSFVDDAENVEFFLARLKAALAAGAERMRDLVQAQQFAAAQSVQLNVSHFAGVTAFAVRKSAFANAGEFNEVLKESVGSAKAAGLSFEDLTTAIAGFQKTGLRRSQAGTASHESLQAFARGGLQKLGVPLARITNGALDIIGTFVKLRRQFDPGAISVEQFQRSAVALGARGSRALAFNADELAHVRKRPGNVNGAAQVGANIILATFSGQLRILDRQLQVFGHTIGRRLLGPILPVTSALKPMFRAITQSVDAHPRPVTLGVLFAAMSAALLLAAGAVTAFEDRILNTIVLPINAIKRIAAKVRRYLPFLPAQEGPLRDPNCVRIVETVAQTIRPGPIAAAMRRFAAAAALAVPLALVPPAIPGAASAAGASPVALAAPAARGTAGGARAIRIEYRPVINAAGMSAQELLAVLRQHSRELLKIIANAENVRARTIF